MRSIFVLIALAASCLAQDADFVQRSIESGARLSVGVYRIERTLIVPNERMLSGSGAGTILDWTGDRSNPVIVKMGSEGGFSYQIQVRDVALLHGKLYVAQFTQNCFILHVRVSSSLSDGIVVDGPGEQLTIQGVTSEENQGVGLRIRSRFDNNGIMIRDCDLHNNDQAGLVLETVDPNVVLEAVVIDHTTIQGNCRVSAACDRDSDGRITLKDLAVVQYSGDLTRLALTLGYLNKEIDSFDVEVRGWVGRTTLEHCWIESTKAIGGLRATPVANRYCSSLTLRGCTLYAPNGPALQLERVYGTYLDDVVLRPYSGVRATRIEYVAPYSGPGLTGDLRNVDRSLLTPLSAVRVQR